MGEIADDMADDYYAGVYSGELCYRCGQSINYCTCDNENINNELKGGLDE